MADHDALLERLEDKFTVGDGCWEWTAGKNKSGYGLFSVDRCARLAHRVLYELLVSPIPDGLHLDHLCRNRGCVRPAHLEPVTPGENMRRVPDRRSANRAKTHCPAGHPYDGENTCHRRDGSRRCRTCHRDRMRAGRDWLGGEGYGSHHRAKTHCPQGHPYDAENTYSDAIGRRQCRVCKRETWRRWYARRKATR